MRLLFFALVAWCIGCGVQRPLPTVPTPGQISYLALGDSYTIGQGVSAEARWPVQLTRLAQQEGLNLAAPEIIARTGWTTTELQTASAEANLRRTYGLVSLLIGVNNQYRGQPVGAYRTEFRQLLRTAIGFAANQPGHVVVLSVPDWGQSPFAQKQGRDPARIGAEIDLFNQAARDECLAAGVAFVDITPLTRAAGTNAAHFAHDGLHYSARQMHLWAAEALPVVRRCLH